jgi:CheY-like chemotaxis protein
MEQRKKLGEILVEQNILSLKTVERVLSIANRNGRRFGEVLAEMELINPEEYAGALAIQYNCRTVFNFSRHSFPRQLLDIITGEVALENCIFPLKLDGNRLALAMADPAITRIIENIAANNNLTIIPFIAPRKDINTAVCKHYFAIDVVEPAQKSVLIIEDDKLILTMLTNYLSSDYQVYTAMDGLQGYKEVISKKPHVILTDKEMPKLDGYGFLDALKNIPEAKHIPVILVSGTTNAEVEAEAFAKGFFDFISKPVKEITLLTRVNRAFDYSEKQRYLFNN